VDAVRIGLSLRALRIRRGWRQIDIARRANVSRGTVSKIERGRLRGVSLDALARVAATLEADLDVRIRWRGEQLDRLLDAGHARLVSAVVARLSRLGWQVAVEVTFSIWGERGSFDILAFHPPSGSVLAVEVKTVVPDFQAMITTLDRKARLAPEVAAERGWKATRSSRLLVIEAGSTARDRIRRLDAAALAALPHRGTQVRSWLENPSGSLAGMLFVRSATQGDRTQRAAGRQRVRRPRTGRNETQAGTPEPSAGANTVARA
jgi:transcriptional regulator with XRE-family HTH domain